MTEVFRRRLIWLLVEKELLAEDFAQNLLSWKNSGFSIDNSVRLTDAKSKESLAEYIARPPLSLKKIRYEPFKGEVLFHTKCSDYLGPTPSLAENCTPLRCARVFGRGSRDEAACGFWRRCTRSTPWCVPNADGRCVAVSRLRNGRQFGMAELQ